MAGEVLQMTSFLLGTGAGRQTSICSHSLLPPLASWVAGEVEVDPDLPRSRLLGSAWEDLGLRR